MKKLKVGIIGCGRISRFHGMPVMAQENAELRAVCDLDLDRAKLMAGLFASARKSGKAPAIKTYTDYVEMIRKEKLDLVHICLPH